MDWLFLAWKPSSSSYVPWEEEEEEEEEMQCG
jgi:hypothetical protein